MVFLEGHRALFDHPKLCFFDDESLQTLLVTCACNGRRAHWKRAGSIEVAAHDAANDDEACDWAKVSSNWQGECEASRIGEDHRTSRSTPSRCVR